MSTTLQTLTYRFTLDTFKNGVQRILQGWETGEQIARKLEVSLCAGKEPYILPLEGITANMYVKRPSQTNPSINACTIDYENNKIIYEVLPTDITEAGIVSMQLKVFDGTKILISPLFGMEVWESQASSSQASSTPQYTALEEALADAQAYSEKAIQQVYIDENNIFTIEFADGTEYTSSAFADAIAEVGQYPLIAEGYACGTQDGEPVEEGSPYYHNNAEYYADQADTSAGNASTSELAAYASEQAAALSETSAEAYKDLSKSYAVGDTGKRTGEDVDNAKYYKERCEQIVASIEGGFIPMGTVTFATLPNLADVEAGWMYDVSDSFTSDSRFNDGGGKTYPAGSNVYATAQSKWDVLSGETPTINGKTGSSITLDGRDIALTGYDKPSAYTPITTLDTINSAIGKLEVRISGLLPHVIVSTETGVTVTLTKDLQTVTATETATGVYQADVPNFGTWTVTAVGHGQTVTDTIAIDTVKIYEKTLTFFKASIAVTYPSGATCVCEGVTADTTPYTFTVWAADDYDVVTTLDGVAKTTSVTITTSGQTESVTVEFGTIVVTLDNAFKGLTVTCADGTTTITKTAPMDSNTLTFRVPNTATWAVSTIYEGTTYSTNAVVSSLSTSVSVGLAREYASIVVTYSDEFKGLNITCSDRTTTLTEAAPSNTNTVTFIVFNTGTWTVSSTYNGDTYSDTAVVSALETTVTASISVLTIKTFAAATDEEIADMVAAADQGLVDLYDDCGWRVGQEHQVSISAISSTGTYDGVSWTVDENQSAQTITLVLMHGDSGDTGLPELVTPVTDKGGGTRTTCHFVVGVKDSFIIKGKMNIASPGTNASSWSACDRRSWCNGGFRGALPSSIRGAFKQFKCISAQTSSGSTNQTSNDYFAIPAVKEIIGGSASSAGADTGYSNLTEFNALTQFKYYTTSANRIKKVNGSAYFYYTRSLRYDNATGYFEVIADNGAPYGGVAGNAYGISPFGVI